MTTTTECQHAWQEEYYGVRCTKCDLFYVDGSAPWDYVDEDALAREEYYYNHGTCEVCGGEWGDGWTTCTCDILDFEDEEKQ